MQLRVPGPLYLLALLAVCPVLALPQSHPGISTAGEIYKKSAPAVVLIELYDSTGKVNKRGSGFLVSSNGAIVTNYHVIAHSKQATVRLANEDAYDAVEVLDIDKRKDIALVKIKAVGLPYLTLGPSSAVEVGDTVLSLSNPLGVFQNSLSQGIVSGIRSGDGYRYFQISAPISPGSSGGPIFNTQGEVIGIAAASLEGGQNLNFAIPIDYARGMLSSNQPQPLASVYEPEPESAKPPEAKAVEAPAITKNASADKPSIPDEMKKSSFVYLDSKLRFWTKPDAEKELGEPTRHRFGYDKSSRVTGDIYAYPDPTQLFREFELNFDPVTKKLAGVYAYPWRMTWEECKQTWGSDATTIRNHDGTRFYAYRGRRLNVLADKNGNVISLGVY